MGVLADKRAAARAGDPAEREHAKLRLVIVALGELYFLVAFLWDRVLKDELGVLVTAACIGVLGVAHFGWMLVRPGINHTRRRAAVLLDIAATTVAMMFAGERGAVFFALYLSVTIGNGFRYGRWYLHYAQALALAGFVPVMLFNPYWRQHPVLGASLLLVLVAIPFYVSALLKRLHALRAQAEAANTAKTKFLAAASHDLRQPMQALSMYASVLQGRIKDPDSLRVVH